MLRWLLVVWRSDSFVVGIWKRTKDRQLWNSERISDASSNTGSWRGIRLCRRHTATCINARKKCTEFCKFCESSESFLPRLLSAIVHGIFTWMQQRHCQHFPSTQFLLHFLSRYILYTTQKCQDQFLFCFQSFCLLPLRPPHSLFHPLLIGKQVQVWRPTWER